MPGETLARTRADTRPSPVRTERLQRYLEWVAPCHAAQRELLARMAALLLAAASGWSRGEATLLADGLNQALARQSEWLLGLGGPGAGLKAGSNAHLQRLRAVHATCVALAPRLRGLMLQLDVRRGEIDALRRQLAHAHAQFRATCDFDAGLNAIDFECGCGCARLCLCPETPEMINTYSSRYAGKPLQQTRSI